jgi:hypothetical protein
MLRKAFVFVLALTLLGGSNVVWQLEKVATAACIPGDNEDSACSPATSAAPPAGNRGCKISSVDSVVIAGVTHWLIDCESDPAKPCTGTANTAVYAGRCSSPGSDVGEDCIADFEEKEIQRHRYDFRCAEPVQVGGDSPAVGGDCPCKAYNSEVETDKQTVCDCKSGIIE